MTRKSPRTLLIIVVGALVGSLTGCTSQADEVPALDISRSELWRTVNVNLHDVDPAWVVTEWPVALVHRSGCDTNSKTMMPKGPPWRYQLVTGRDNPSPDYLNRINGGLDSLAHRGFTVAPPPRPDDPRDRTATDSRGFHVDVEFTEKPGGQTRVAIWSWSPCVRHPNEVDDW
ncbi:hypothetical protein [Gordonia sp. (in: high G+C Gram-positive bacteria)]|uniref:hypothetical protein n=1 Tax=Gordonia sp. (in: high G+C Gram-positive bacteria) TaxID=84139 RepID=UPI003C72A606